MFMNIDQGIFNSHDDILKQNVDMLMQKGRGTLGKLSIVSFSKI